ncbi:COG1355, Predicted dioxygenase [hydrothermal vent metagenome]|uniref:COG1355, Predicted dioxygenase n=1 Tax=hydrothermal vent metagenome TaxID=652676 RepID=A0A1W1C8B6_9ZZZZ
MEIKNIRESSVSGVFYPNSCQKLNIYFKKFTEKIGDNLKSKLIYKNKIPKVIIAPHAGYIYSGFTANVAYKLLSKSNAKRVIVIGPSHHYYFKGISASYYEKYQSPCGYLDIDTEYLIKMSKDNNIGFEPKAHKKEHSTEVQMPFIKHYLPNAKVIELIYGDINYEIISNIINYLLKDKNNAIVISTDLSHFYTQDKAKLLDKECLNGVATLDINKISNRCEACGLLGLKAVIKSAKDNNLNSYLLDYRTSFDYSKDNQSVVGYMSAILYDK